MQVYEISPPLVKTAMSGFIGEDCGEFCKAVFNRLKRGEKEIGYKLSEDIRLADRAGQQQYVNALTQQAVGMGMFKPYTSQLE